MDLQPILDALAKFAQQLLVIALPILIGFGINWLKLKTDEVKQSVKDRLDDKYDWAIDKAVEYAVSAAEQTLTGGLAKKEFAVKWAQDYLTSRGVKIDVAFLADIVEAQVHDKFNQE